MTCSRWCKVEQVFYLERKGLTRTIVRTHLSRSEYVYHCSLSPFSPGLLFPTVFPLTTLRSLQRSLPRMKEQNPQQQSFTIHLLKNFSLICLSIISLPVTTTVVASCLLYGYLFPTPALPAISHLSTPPKTVLVSSLAMAKGLSLARAFYLAGHRVIGLDFQRAGIPSSGKYSRSLSGHYELQTPINPMEKKEYVQHLVKIIKEEKVDLWVCVSGVATTIEDAISKDEIERETSCKVFQLNPETSETLHDKHQFIEKTAEIGLKIPETRIVESQEEALDFLARKKVGKYVLKSVWLDDVSRADMTLYPRSTTHETKAIISGLEITIERPWIFQEFIKGTEYCTHAVVVRGCVTAFVSCPSSEVLMHYKALPAKSNHSKKLLEFTEKYSKSLEGGQATGQLSFDIIVQESKSGDRELQLYPIECNPRTHTAVVLFEKDARRLADCYLSLIDSSRVSPKDICIPDATVTDNFYWIGHDVVSLLLLPLLPTFDFWSFLIGLKEFTIHLLFWKDATFEVWDPLPFWFLYHVYWPGLFIWSLLTGKKWSRINVSTTRIFECN